MKKVITFLFFAGIGCASNPKIRLPQISLTDSNHSVEIRELDYAIASEISRDSSWKNLIPVFRTPADTDLKNYQPAQPGSYKLQDSAVVFTPDTPFLKGQTYFIRYFKYAGDDSKWDYIRGKQKLRDMHYIDLIFKP